MGEGGGSWGFGKDSNKELHIDMSFNKRNKKVFCTPALKIISSLHVLKIQKI